MTREGGQGYINKWKTKNSEIACEHWDYSGSYKGKDKAIEELYGLPSEDTWGINLQAQFAGINLNLIWTFVFVSLVSDSHFLSWPVKSRDRSAVILVWLSVRAVRAHRDETEAVAIWGWHRRFWYSERRCSTRCADRHALFLRYRAVHVKCLQHTRRESWYCIWTSNTSSEITERARVCVCVCSGACWKGSLSQVDAGQLLCLIACDYSGVWNDHVQSLSICAQCIHKSLKRFLAFKRIIISDVSEVKQHTESQISDPKVDIARVFFFLHTGQALPLSVCIVRHSSSMDFV